MMPNQRKPSRVPLRPKPAACSEANSLPRTAMDRRVNLENRRPHRTVQLEPKKRGSRVADLEMKLDDTMMELKKLKEQLTSEEVSKRVGQKKLEYANKVALEGKQETPLPVEEDGDSCVTTDVGQVAREYSEENESPLGSMALIHESAAESLQIAEMKAKLAEKEKGLNAVVAEKGCIEKDAEEAKASWRKKNDEMEAKLAAAVEELRQSKTMVEQMKQKLEAQDNEKVSMEAEMRRLRIQTDQWRKASEAAASILGHDSFRSEKKPPEKYSNGFSLVIAGTEEGEEEEEGITGLKRRGNGGAIRALGELWKKKGQQK